MFKAALFDLDGVVFDTEPQYSVFWGSVCRQYHPEIPGLEHMIKGQTLTQIFDGHFNGMTDAQRDIVTRLDEFEGQMSYDYVKDFPSFVQQLRDHGVKTALVTSSNKMKMDAVLRARPEVAELFDEMLMAEDFTESKPSPDCYLKAAKRLQADIRECVVFEDSFNGIKSGRSADMVVVGLSTTNPAEKIAPLCDVVVPDYTHLDILQCEKLLRERNNTTKTNN